MSHGLPRPPLLVISRFLPDPAGPAGARLVYAFAEGARRLGREVAVRSWWPHGSAGPLPSWLRWEQLPVETWWRVRGRALLRPRSDVAAMGWELPAEATVIAEDPLSVAAVAGHPRSAVTVHYLTALDRWGLKRLHVKDLQDLRAERRAPRGVAVTAAYSDRVARRLGRGALAVPAAIEIPARTLVLPDQPVATCVADWSWAPNRAALGRLLAAWPLVRAELPAARLLLAGYGDPAVGVMAGVSVLGAVADSAAVLAQACVLVFPCPATSGPKVKVMEAASLGVPVLTTPAGLEGLRLSADAAALVAQRAGPVELAAAVVDLLRDPGRRAAMATRARADLAASHAPEAAARVRLACVEDALSAAGRAC